MLIVLSRCYRYPYHHHRYNYILLQDPVSTAVGTVIAAINTELAALVPSSGSINGTQVQENIASLLYLAQTSIFNAVPAVSNGTQTAANFTSAYTGVNLTNTADVALQYLTKEAPAFNML